MRVLHSLLAFIALASGALAEDGGRALVPAKVLGERMSDQRSGGTAIGNVIVNLPIPSAPNPTSRPASNPPAAPVPTKRIIMVEVVDFIYDWEQVNGPRFQVIPDDTINYYQEKGKYVVERSGKKYEFVAVEIRRK